MTNDEIIKNLKKRKQLRILIIIFSIITIILAVLSLTIKLNFLYALLPAFVVYILKRIMDKTILPKKDSKNNKR